MEDRKREEQSDEERRRGDWARVERSSSASATQRDTHQKTVSDHDEIINILIDARDCFAEREGFFCSPLVRTHKLFCPRLELQVCKF